MAGLFDLFGVNAADVSENPYQITVPNRYKCVVTESDVKEFGPEGAKVPYWTIEYTVKDGGQQDGKSANSLHRLVPWTPEERSEKGDHEAMNARLLSNYKKELLNLGIPEEALNAFDPKNPTHRNKVVGIKGSAWFGPQKSNPEFNAVSDFQRAEAAADTSSSDVAPAGNSAPTVTTKESVDLDALSGW